MPRQNRVTPLGDLIADESRGGVYGNRGCLHDANGAIRRRFAGTRWISCRLEFRGWQRGQLLRPGRFTELFFLDEATAFAAGHRPCALCRRADYDEFCRRWRELHPGDTTAALIDRRLHAQRVLASGERRLHTAPAETLPTGACVLHGGEPWIVTGGGLRRWSPSGYGDTDSLPGGSVDLVTPPSTAAMLRDGWSGVVPFLHSSAA